MTGFFDSLKTGRASALPVYFFIYFFSAAVTRPASSTVAGMI